MKKLQNPKIKIKFKSIQFKLTLSFLVPVACIVILGIISYNMASDAIVKEYKNSTQQTVDMMQQYMTLSLSSEKNNFKSYLSDQEVKYYFQGINADTTQAVKKKELSDKLEETIQEDGMISAIYMISAQQPSIYSGSSAPSSDAYNAYLKTTQGQTLHSDTYNWHIFGVDEEVDKILGTSSGSYALRIAREVTAQKMILIIDMKKSFIQNAMQSMDTGKGGYVALVTSDGKEFYSNDESIPTENMFAGEDYFTKKIGSEDESGSLITRIHGKKYLFVYSKLSGSDVVAAALVPQKTLTSKTGQIKWITCIITLIAAIIAGVLGTINSRRISGAIAYILRQLRKVAAGDLTVHLTSKTEDEFGQLCDGINDMVFHVRTLIEGVNGLGSQVHESASYVTDSSGVFRTATDEIQNAVSEIKQGVRRLDGDSENCLSQMDALSTKISDVTTDTGEIEQLTDRTKNMILQGMESVEQLTVSAKSTASVTKHVMVTMGALDGNIKKINSIVESINSIAEQTNLLSLNASIEAARAGDAGRGFSVVAQEIRNLSEQCLDSAKQITDIVKEIVLTTENAVKVTKEAEETVSSQTGAVENTTASFKEINELVTTLIQVLDTISVNVHQMDQSRCETLTAIEGISNVSANTADISNSVYKTVVKQMDQIASLDKEAQELQTKAEKLVKELETFTI